MNEERKETKLIPENMWLYPYFLNLLPRKLTVSHMYNNYTQWFHPYRPLVAIHHWYGYDIILDKDFDISVGEIILDGQTVSLQKKVSQNK